MSGSKKPLVLIFLVVLVDLIGFGMIIPILPYYAKFFGASATQLGWLMMIYSGMQFLFSPFWGRLSDRIGRRPVILASIAGIGASMVIVGFAESLLWLFIGRALAGLFGANISAASAYIADITPPQDRAKGMGMIGAAFGLGFLFGPALGGILSKFGYGTPAFAAAGLSLFNLLFALKFLPETPASQERRLKDRKRLSLSVWGETFRNPPVALSIALFFLVTMGMAQLETSFAFFLLERFKLDAYHAGLLLALMALVMVGIQGRAIGPMVKRFGESALIRTGAVFMTIALVGVAISMNLQYFVFFLIVYAFGYAVTNPSLSALASRNTPMATQGATMGVYQSCGSLARIIGPISAGFLYDSFGIEFPFLAAAVLFFLTFLLALTAKNIWLRVK